MPAPASTSRLSLVAHGVWLDHRLALFHPEQSWLAVADLHLGYAERRRRRGCLIPDWGGGETETRLLTLLAEHRPHRLILAGDVVDGLGSLDAALKVLDGLRSQVSELILLAGNHDRPALKHLASFSETHLEDGFFFHHGHQSPAVPKNAIEIIGHHHPAVVLRDGAGLRLKLPVLIREQVAESPVAERWILPAFSPWAAGGEYQSSGSRLATWACAPQRVWPLPASATDARLTPPAR